MDNSIKIFLFKQKLEELINDSQLDFGTLNLIIESLHSEVHNLYLQEVNQYLIKNQSTREVDIPFHMEIDPNNPEPQIIKFDEPIVSGQK